MKDAFYLCLKLKVYLCNNKYIIKIDNNIFQNDKICIKIKLIINK